MFGSEVWKILKIQTVWKPDVFLPIIYAGLLKLFYWLSWQFIFYTEMKCQKCSWTTLEFGHCILRNWYVYVFAVYKCLHRKYFNTQCPAPLILDELAISVFAKAALVCIAQRCIFTTLTYVTLLYVILQATIWIGIYFLCHAPWRMEE